MVELDQDEREILEAYHEGRLERAALSRAQLEEYRSAAREKSRKDRRINIRISSRDLEELRIRARAEGMPYQTLIASVLHRYVSGRLVDRE